VKLGLVSVISIGGSELIVYTALFGDYDRLRSTPFLGVEHVLFTDENIKVRGWETRVVERKFANAARDNRFYKLQPQLFFPGEVTLYHDANMQLKTNPVELLKWFKERTRPDANLFALGHPLEHTLLMEFAWLRERGIVDEGLLNVLLVRYGRVPTFEVGIEARLLISTPEASNFFNVWWSEVRDFAHRDQLSFHYAKHVEPCSMGVVPLRDARHHFRIFPHAKPQLRGVV
jgi:hypothetical protein